MLQQTIDRLKGLISAEDVWVITNSEQVEAVREICPDIPASQVVAEPVGRDTAPAVALAALLVQQKHGDHSFAMLPADHVIHDHASFQADLQKAFAAAEENPSIATIGIKPTFPSTGYGYIHARGGPAGAVQEVRRFVEKPSLETAEEYVATGEYFWNGGIFVWRPSTILDAIATHCAPLASSFGNIRKALADGEDLSTILPREYPQLEKISIDYAVMEKAKNVVMIQSSFDWDDVGSWPAIERHSEPDESQNVIQGTVVTEDSTGNLIRSDEGHLVGLIGVEGLMVIHTKDATLICPKDRAQDVKKLVKKIEAQEGGEAFL